MSTVKNTLSKLINFIVTSWCKPAPAMFTNITYDANKKVFLIELFYKGQHPLTDKCIAVLYGATSDECKALALDAWGI